MLHGSGEQPQWGGNRGREPVFRPEGPAGKRVLLGLQGAALYDALGPLQEACLLNLFAKTSHASAVRCYRFLTSLAVLHQDRCFCLVDPAMPEFLRQSSRFKSAPNTLHEPLAG